MYQNKQMPNNTGPLPENVELSSILMPRAFTTIPRLTQFSYITAANNWVRHRGSDDYLDTFESDLRDTLKDLDVIHQFTDGIITNASMTIASNKAAIDKHFKAMAPTGENVDTARVLSMTDTRVVWEIEYDR